MAVVIETTIGDFTIDLFIDSRPQACKNFLKLCKMKYYNFCLFHSVQPNFLAQTGDPSGTGTGGESIYGLLYGENARYFEAEVMPKLKHNKPGLVSMVNCGNNMLGSQFFITLGEDLVSLDGEHCVFGEISEGTEVVLRLNEAICDTQHRPYKDIRITHTIILEDPFEDPSGLIVPDMSPEATQERLANGRIGADEEIDETAGMTAAQVEELKQEREAKARATILEIVGDLPDAEMAPPENVLFVCKLNPVTTDDDLEIIFSRFGKVKSCEVIRDKNTGDSLQYAFVEFDDQKSCEEAYFKMDNVLIDDRRIHVDFSQSVAKMRWRGKGRGVEYFEIKDQAKDSKSSNHRVERSDSKSRSSSRRDRDHEERDRRRERGRDRDDDRQGRERDRDKESDDRYRRRDERDRSRSDWRKRESKHRKDDYREDDKRYETKRREADSSRRRDDDSKKVSSSRKTDEKRYDIKRSEERYDDKRCDDKYDDKRVEDKYDEKKSDDKKIDDRKKDKENKEVNGRNSSRQADFVKGESIEKIENKDKERDKNSKYSSPVLLLSKDETLSDSFNDSRELPTVIEIIEKSPVTSMTNDVPKVEMKINEVISRGHESLMSRGHESSMSRGQANESRRSSKDDKRQEEYKKVGLENDESAEDKLSQKSDKRTIETRKSEDKKKSLKRKRKPSESRKRKKRHHSSSSESSSESSDSSDSSSSSDSSDCKHNKKKKLIVAKRYYRGGKLVKEVKKKKRTRDTSDSESASEESSDSDSKRRRKSKKHKKVINIFKQSRKKSVQSSDDSQTESSSSDDSDAKSKRKKKKITEKHSKKKSKHSALKSKRRRKEESSSSSDSEDSAHNKSSNKKHKKSSKRSKHSVNLVTTTSE